mgnify:CR=1 FL=1
MQEKEPILKVEDLHFTYNGEKTALNGVDLNIYEGEKIAVLGSNGAGKSTFFLNINGVFEVSSRRYLLSWREDYKEKLK